MNHIGGIMVSVVDRRLDSRSGQAKDYKIVASPLSMQN
jgi:hypothetical protein